jgi:DNA modification methylase
MKKAAAVALFSEGQSQINESRSIDRALRANDLSGRDWTRNSISVWNDIRKTAEEAKLGHPAMFPGSLVERLLLSFSRDSQKVVLDPFCGSGATLVAANKVGKLGIGFEVAGEYHDLAVRRLRQTQSRLFGANDAPDAVVHRADSRRMCEFLEPRSVDICITSPPYWDILSRKRSADSKPVRDYAQGDGDLSRITSYEVFLEEMAVVFGKVSSLLKPGCYCMVVVMDIRKQDKFYPFHADMAARLSRDDVGFIFDDLIIWDRRHEYNNLRPLGYPTTFRINKIHEYILIFRKPK